MLGDMRANTSLAIVCTTLLLALACSESTDSAENESSTSLPIEAAPAGTQDAQRDEKQNDTDESLPSLNELLPERFTALTAA